MHTKVYVRKPTAAAEACLTSTNCLLYKRTLYSVL